MSTGCCVRSTHLQQITTRGREKQLDYKASSPANSTLSSSEKLVLLVLLCSSSIKIESVDNFYIYIGLENKIILKLNYICAQSFFISWVFGWGNVSQGLFSQLQMEKPKSKFVCCIGILLFIFCSEIWVLFSKYQQARLSLPPLSIWWR